MQSDLSLLVAMWPRWATRSGTTLAYFRLYRSCTQDNALTRPWDQDGETQHTEISTSNSSSAAHDMGAYNFSQALHSAPRRQSSQLSTTSQDSYSTITLRETYGQRQQGPERSYAFSHNSSLGPHTSHDQPGPFVAANLPRTNSGPRPTISPQELTSAVVTSDPVSVLDA